MSILRLTAAPQGDDSPPPGMQSAPGGSPHR